MIYLAKLPNRKLLCHKGTKDPIIFDDQSECQKWLDNNEHPEDDFEMIECNSRDEAIEYVRSENER